MGDILFFFEKTFPSKEFILREATFVNALRYGVGVAGSEKGSTFASAIGNNGAFAGRASGNGSEAL
ncbi:hypothetical protein [uncultured Acetobacteroides sp.]|uniref:hypothetical protein n=1 Tax=uncultured Acetobacteroides sp. TaxID=1760811 RepID=UPI0029F5A71B|nr:hypothetical protein [uncultured Acetobacteroides sp.]